MARPEGRRRLPENDAGQVAGVICKGIISWHKIRLSPVQNEDF